jgi:hypothetical protein
MMSAQRLAIRTSLIPWKDLFADPPYWPRSEALANFTYFQDVIALSNINIT